MIAPAPDYRVKTKAEQVRGDQEAIFYRTRPVDIMPLAMFVALMFATDDLSKVQRKVIAKLLTWEGVDIKVRLYRTGLFISLKGEDGPWPKRAHLSVGPRGGLSNALTYGGYSGVERQPRTAGAGWAWVLHQMGEHVGERGIKRAERNRVMDLG